MHGSGHTLVVDVGTLIGLQGAKFTRKADFDVRAVSYRRHIDVGPALSADGAAVDAVGHPVYA